MKYLIRKYNTNHDKTNQQSNALNDALQYIGKTESDIYLKVDWLHFTDLFFISTNDYIRVNNNL